MVGGIILHPKTRMTKMPISWLIVAKEKADKMFPTTVGAREQNAAAHHKTTIVERSNVPPVPSID